MILELELRSLTTDCQEVLTWPLLKGDKGDQYDTMAKCYVRSKGAIASRKSFGYTYKNKFYVYLHRFVCIGSKLSGGFIPNC